MAEMNPMAFPTNIGDNRAISVNQTPGCFFHCKPWLGRTASPVAHFFNLFNFFFVLLWVITIFNFFKQSEGSRGYLNPLLFYLTTKFQSFPLLGIHCITFFGVEKAGYSIF